MHPTLHPQARHPTLAPLARDEQRTARRCPAPLVSASHTGQATAPGVGIHRLLLSRGANAYARLALGINVKDSTAGFRAFRAEVLRGIHLEEVNSHGYCFQIDLTLRVLDAGYTVVELPIEFKERETGESKMSKNIVVEAMKSVTAWGWQRRFGKKNSTSSS